MKTDCLYSYHAVREGLRGRRRAIELYVDENLSRDKLDELSVLARDRSVPVRSRRRQDLDRLAGTVHHQGVVLRIESFVFADLDEILTHWQASGQSAFFLLLDGITDPHNLGAILRNADASGCLAVFLPKDRNCRITNVVDRVSAGAVEHVPICQVTNLARTIQQLKDSGVWVYGLSADTDSISLYDSNLTGHIALVVGSEDVGLRQRTRTLCDGLIAIPMAGGVDSLNAASATAVALFEVVRQKKSVDEKM